MKLLLHTCCAPCLSGSLIPFKEEGMDITSYFYNPNIHPITEYNRRKQALERFAYLDDFELLVSNSYPYKEFLKRALEIESGNGDTLDISRCSYCVEERLKNTHDLALKQGFEFFSTTLLLSKYQDHEYIKKIGYRISEDSNIEFIYKDLRRYWKDSIRISKELGIYRQGYCGCIFSENERYG